jgi:hypothetical protein
MAMARAIGKDPYRARDLALQISGEFTVSVSRPKPAAELTFMMPRISYLSRRAFLRNSTATLATLSIVPGSVLGLNGAEPPSSLSDLAQGGR